MTRDDVTEGLGDRRLTGFSLAHLLDLRQRAEQSRRFMVSHPDEDWGGVWADRLGRFMDEIDAELDSRAGLTAAVALSDVRGVG